MRKLSLFLTLLILLLGTAMAGAAYLIPPGFYKQKIEEQASAMLGRQLRVNGPVTLRFWPSLQVRAEMVTLANPPEFSETNFATMKVMRTSIAVIPLFSRRVEIKEFTLVEPKIVLETRKNGTVNWIMGDPEKPKPKVSASFKRAPGALPMELSLGVVRLIDGDIRIIDHLQGTAHRLSKVNLDLNVPALDAPVAAKGSFALDGTDYNLDASLGGIRQFLEGQRTALSLKLDNELFSVAFDGAFDESSDVAANGTLDLRVPSVRALAASTGSTLPETPGTFGAFAVSGSVRANMTSLAFTKARISLDDIAGTGNFRAVFSGSRPKFTGDLDIAKLDLTPYLPPALATGEGQSIAPWSTTTLDFGVLKAADSRFDLNLGALQIRDIKIGKSALQTVLTNGRLQANLVKMELYDGLGSGKIVINTRGTTPTFSLAADIAKVQFRPFLTDAIKFQRLTGTGAVKFSLTGAGTSQDKIMRSLAGSGNLRLKDGQIIGINLAATLRSAQNFLSSGALPTKINETQATDFTDLTASFTAKNGIARNTDFLMLSPLIRVVGQGVLDIGRQTVDYTLTARAVASLKGQGGKADLAGIKAPFRIHGPWNNIKAGLDTRILKKRAKQVISNLLDQNLGGGAGSALKSMFGISDSSSAKSSGEKTQKSDEEKAIKAISGLFKKKKKPKE